jgi:hypothetical protein
MKVDGDSDEPPNRTNLAGVKNSFELGASSLDISLAPIDYLASKAGTTIHAPWYTNSRVRRD